MKIEEVINELKERGHEAIKHTVYKNGVEMESIIIKNGECSPTIYWGGVLDQASTVCEAADLAEKIFRENKDTQFDMKQIINSDFIYEHIRIGLEHENAYITAVKRDTEYEGLVQYLYISEINERSAQWSIKITDDIVKSVDIDIDDLWRVAEERNNAEATIKSMIQVFRELNSEMASMFPPEEMMEESACPMYVISNLSRFRGASAILNKEMLMQFAKDRNCNRVVILPSSVHECILMPSFDEEPLDVEMLTEMVNMVNDTELAPEEVLFDRAIAVNF